MEGEELRKWRVDEALYFHVALEPHLKHSGSITGGKILFLAEVPVDSAKKTVTNSDDENALWQEAERLAAQLLPIAMTGQQRGQGEDIMRFSCHLVPQPSEDLLEHTADAEKDGVRLWLLGANIE
jgi:hypothetical protein